MQEDLCQVGSRPGHVVSVPLSVYGVEPLIIRTLWHTLKSIHLTHTLVHITKPH